MSGLFFCFNPSCSEKGNLLKLVKFMTKCNDFQALRLINKYSVIDSKTLNDRLQETLNATDLPDYPFPQVLERMKENMWLHPEGRDYMHSRGFNDETLRHFNIGYSPKKQMVVTPMYSHDSRPLGFIGRGITGKVFENTKHLPSSSTLWNIHNAKKHDTVIICEGNFDGLKIHQAGYPNVVACLMGSFSDKHKQQVDKYFSTVIIMTDFDDVNIRSSCRVCYRQGFNQCQGHNPGRDLGETIASTMKNKNVLWASYNDSVIYPNGKKDAAEMTEREIEQCIKNATSNFVYHARLTSR